MLRSMVHAAARGHVSVRGLCRYWKPRGSPQSLLLAVVGKEASFTVVSMAVGSSLRMRDLEDICDALSPPPERKSLDEKPLKRVLENHDRDAEV